MATTNFTTATGGTNGVYCDGDTWATERNNTTGDGNAAQVAGAWTGAIYEINRFFIPTDFSSLSATATVTSAKFYFYASSKQSNDDDTASIILTTQAATNTVAMADYDNITLNSPTTYGTSAAFSTLTPAGWFSIDIDAAGLALIQAAAGVGYVKFGLRCTHDIANTTPTALSSVTIDIATNKPYFAVTYTLPSSFIAMF